jgi:hypothetical protein
MEGIAGGVLDKLSPEFIQRGLVAMAAFYAFLCVRGKTIQPFRKDKNGNFYLYSHTFADNKKRIKKLESVISDTLKEVKVISMTSLRTELLLYINMHPEKVEVIEKMAQEYTSRGGNSYIVNGVIPAWRGKYAKNITEGRI